MKVHDLTKADYAFTPKDAGQLGWISCWTGPKPHVGDYLLLRNGDRSSRYVVESVDLCMNVDPPTMWIADLRFAPRVDVAICEWFALCVRPSDGTVSHPVMGEVPCCARCASNHDLELKVSA